MTTPPLLTPEQKQQQIEKRRQQILDALSAIPALTIDGTHYLPHNQALESLAALMYPAGIQTEKQYETVTTTLDKACAMLGYGQPAQLEPPTVSFAQRGSYRRQYKERITDDLLHRLINKTNLLRWTPDTEYPNSTIYEKTLLSDLHLNLFGRREKTGEPTILYIKHQLPILLERYGWQREIENPGHYNENVIYVMPAPLDEDKAKHDGRLYIEEYPLAPLYSDGLYSAVERGAFGIVRTKRQVGQAPAIDQIVRDLLIAHDYEPEARAGHFHPQPLAIPDTAPFLAHIAALPRVTKDKFVTHAILADDVLDYLAHQLPHLKKLARKKSTSNQLFDILERAPFAGLLRKAGYEPELVWEAPRNLRLADPQHQHTATGDHLREKQRGAYGVIATIHSLEQIHKGDIAPIELAKGLRGYTFETVLDEKEGTIIYLRLVGPKQAVKANWAALMNGGRAAAHRIDNVTVRLSGMKEHIRLQTTLPCGWQDMVLIHKQASLKEATPDRPIYLLSDGENPIPANFYALLNKTISIPILPEWTTYLWEKGQEKELIARVNQGRGRQYAGWKAISDTDQWQAIIQGGLQSGAIGF